MYSLAFLPSALQEMKDIVGYISTELSNPTAAQRLAETLMEAAKKLQVFPYANSTFFPIKPLKHEYRKLLVQNYILLYWIDEPGKTVTVASVTYARRNYERLL